MFVEEIKLINYRNYQYLNMNFCKEVNVIYGDNGQGKTNIIESIFFCSTGRSHRTSKDSELVNKEERSFYIKVLYEKGSKKESIEVGYEKNGKKQIKINEIPSQKIGNIIGKLNVVMFSPEDIMIIKGGPVERRRTFDISISQQKPSYFLDLQQYNKIILQRNALLKSIKSNKSLIDTLEIWDNNMIITGSRIIYKRNEYIRELNKHYIKNHKLLTNNNDKAEIIYSPSVKAENYEDIKNIEQCFKEALKNVRDKEIENCYTFIGPQRDDYKFTLNNESIKQYGSQGQQRTAALALKISEIELVKENIGEYPVLLLDDVMSELDIKRRKYLFERISGIQTFITTTDKEIIQEKIKCENKYFYINDGNVTEEKI
mgnify:CR=1 FL=1